MKYIFSSITCLFLSSICFFQQAVSSQTTQPQFSLGDFLKYESALEEKTETVFKSLSDTAIVAQLIMPAIGKFGQTDAVINSYIDKGIIGGLLMLNGSKESFTAKIAEINAKNKSLGTIPFLFSADAEPSLFNRKIIGSTPVKKANELGTFHDVTKVAEQISEELNLIGINYNFSPVVDMSSNKTVGYRGFGTNPENIVPWSNEFINVSQDSFQIIATAKHFPGHGLVSGDSHKELQVINGEMKELGIYPPLIENGVLSIMIGHIAVINNPEFDTKGLPATCSEKIVNQLLRDSLGFEGLIVTDAMNMGGVAKVVSANTMVIDAGCDILLMPLDAAKAHAEILKKYREDPEFKNKVDMAAKRILRMKICLNLI